MGSDQTLTPSHRLITRVRMSISHILLLMINKFSLNLITFLQKKKTEKFKECSDVDKNSKNEKSKNSSKDADSSSSDDEDDALIRESGKSS